MPPYGEPDWATPGDTTKSNVSTGLPPPAMSSFGTTANTTNGNTADGLNRARFVIFCLSMLNIGLAAMMGTLGVLSLLSYTPNSADDISLAFLSCYMIIFAALLFLYEFIWWQPVPSLNITFRKNFGFLYGLKGKGFYLIFIAFLTLGIRKDSGNQSGVKGLDWATGAAWLAAGFLHLYVACSMPETAAVYKPPTAGLSTLGQSDPNALPTTSTTTGTGMTDINPI